MAKLNKIIIHWTAGTYEPNAHELECYHYLIKGNGTVVPGKYKPEDNLNCSDGKYAAHTGGGNTGAIGVSMCGMYVPPKTPVEQTKYPLTKFQCERCFQLVAELAKKYNIPITAQTILTHYEFGKAHPNTSSAGKIDINWLPPYIASASTVGDFIRNKVEWYFKKL